MDEHAKQPLLLFTLVKITATTKAEAVAVEAVATRTIEVAVEVVEAVATRKNEAVVAVAEVVATMRKEANAESAVKATVIHEAAAKIAQAQVQKNE